jgi:hypothetical protein
MGMMPDAGADVIPAKAGIQYTNIKYKINIAGGRPAASYFLLLHQNKVTKEKATPACRPYGVPSISRKQAGLRNSTWRGAHPRPTAGLEQCSPKPPLTCG